MNGHTYCKGYYLAGGIYPKLAVFVKTIPTPSSESDEYFCNRQEGERMDIERAFGVPKAR